MSVSREDGFIRSRRCWVFFAVLTELLLLISIVSTARGENNLVLQLVGITSLFALIVLSVARCRCPHCRRFLFDRESWSLGWAFKKCPHCEKSLSL